MLTIAAEALLEECKQTVADQLRAGMSPQVVMPRAERVAGLVADLVEEAAAAEAEVARLQAIVDEIELQAPPTPEEWHAKCDEAARYREALEEIAADAPPYQKEIARAALEQGADVGA